jgi:hypothetical protein
MSSTAKMMLYVGFLGWVSMIVTQRIIWMAILAPVPTLSTNNTQEFAVGHVDIMWKALASYGKSGFQQAGAILEVLAILHTEGKCDSNCCTLKAQLLIIQNRFSEALEHCQGVLQLRSCDFDAIECVHDSHMGLLNADISKNFLQSQIQNCPSITLMLQDFLDQATTSVSNDVGQHTIMNDEEIVSSSTNKEAQLSSSSTRDVGNIDPPRNDIVIENGLNDEISIDNISIHDFVNSTIKVDEGFNQSSIESVEDNGPRIEAFEVVDRVVAVERSDTPSSIGEDSPIDAQVLDSSEISFSNRQYNFYEAAEKMLPSLKNTSTVDEQVHIFTPRGDLSNESDVIEMISPPETIYYPNDINYEKFVGNVTAEVGVDNISSGDVKIDISVTNEGLQVASNDESRAVPTLSQKEIQARRVADGYMINYFAFYDIIQP